MIADTARRFVNIFALLIFVALVPSGTNHGQLFLFLYIREYACDVVNHFFGDLVVLGDVDLYTAEPRVNILVDDGDVLASFLIGFQSSDELASGGLVSNSHNYYLLYLRLLSSSFVSLLYHGG
jgi:hypothetical protein